MSDSETMVLAIGIAGIIFGLIGMALPGDYGVYSKLQFGNLASRPATGVQEQWYYANDTEEMFYWNGSWYEVPLGNGGSVNDYDIYGKVKTGTFAARPAAGTVDRWYYCTDTQDMYYDDGVAWYKIEHINSTVFSAHTSNATAHHGDWGHYGLMEYGLNASLPSAGIIGRWWYSNDTDQIYYDNGTAWNEFLLRRNNFEREGFRAYAYVANPADRQEIPTATFTKVNFTVEEFDLNGNFDLDNDQFSPQTDGEIWLIAAHVTLINLGDGKKIICSICKGDSPNSGRYSEGRMTVGGTDLVGVFVSDILELDSDDVITIKIYHNHGSNLDVFSDQYQGASFAGWRLK